MSVGSFLKSVFLVAFTSVVGYIAFIGLLTIPALQTQVIYLNRVTLTWFQDVNFPEHWGFLKNQVTPFTLSTVDGETLHAWHILPLEAYRRNQYQLLQETSGLVNDVTTRLSFKLLKEDPDAMLVLYFHGAAGTLGSGWRPPSYRAISAGAPDKIHTVAIDYRGFGQSTGLPSEEGLLTDALTLAEWAMNVAGIPPSKIVLFSQSLGTAVALSLVQYLVSQPEPVLFSGVVLVAPFVDVELLTATYRIAGIIPILGAVARFPKLLAYINSFILHKWSSKDNIADFVRRCESLPGDTLKCHITILHGQDDYDIPWSHSDKLFWHAVNASIPLGISYDDMEKDKQATRRDMGEGGWSVDKRTQKSIIKEHILKYGLHDVIMSYPAVSLTVLNAFHRM
jgi:abhydrolase domain-containing protein 12